MAPTPTRLDMKIYPVIHYLSDEQAQHNAALAARYGCAGVFLIDMQRRYPKEMLPCALAIADKYPDLKVGVNHLGFTGFAGLERNIKAGLPMSWTDECVTHTQHVTENDPGLDRLKKALASSPGHEFFAGVAFKYQPDEKNAGHAANRILQLGGVPATSGPATGRSAALEKLQEIRSAIGPDARLAVASGVTADNIGQLRTLVTDILVATSITATDGSELFVAEELLKLVLAATTESVEA